MKLNLFEKNKIILLKKLFLALIISIFISSSTSIIFAFTPLELFPVADVQGVDPTKTCIILAYMFVILLLVITSIYNFFANWIYEARSKKNNTFDIEKLNRMRQRSRTIFYSLLSIVLIPPVAVILIILLK